MHNPCKRTHPQLYTAISPLKKRWNMSLGWHVIHILSRPLLASLSVSVSLNIYQQSMHRDVAFQVFPYACIGQLHFLNLSLRTHPTYTQLLERLTQGSQTLLDLGSCFAQDLRQLVQDGVPSERLHGVDVDQKFLDLGYKLFLDKNSLKSTLLAVDVLARMARKSWKV